MQKRFDPGFTLIEIAIVLVIVGLLAGFGASMIVPMQKKAKRMESQKAVDAVVESILGYAFIYNRIPDEIEFRDLITNKKDPWLKDFYYLFDNRLTKYSSTE